jgi:hypothetical protein
MMFYSNVIKLQTDETSYKLVLLYRIYVFYTYVRTQTMEFVLLFVMYIYLPHSTQTYKT